MSSDLLPKLVFRLASEPDALCIGVLGAQVWLDAFAPNGVSPTLAKEVVEYFSTAVMSKEISSPTFRFIVATKDEHFIGFAQIDLSARQANAPDEPTVELHRLYVMQSFRRQGIGKALLAQVDTLARANGARSIWLTTWTGNGRAIEFFRSQGFHDTGSTKYTFESEEYENRILARPSRPATAA